MFGKARSEETKAKISNNHKRLSGKDNGRATKFIFISPQGKTFKVEGEFKEFCKRKNLPMSTMCKCLKLNRAALSGKASGWSVNKAG